MSSQHQNRSAYDPNDLEALMMHKSFSELFDDERLFALQHVEDEAEYTSMRNMLLELHGMSLSDDFNEEVPTDIRSQIVKEVFEANNKRTGGAVWGIWKNDTPWFKQPLVQITSIAAVVTIGIFLRLQDQPKIVTENPQNNPDTTELKLEDPRFRDKNPSSTPPPAPEQLMAAIPEIKSVQVEENTAYDNAPEMVRIPEEPKAMEDIVTGSNSVDSEQETSNEDSDLSIAPPTMSEPMTTSTSSSGRIESKNLNAVESLSQTSKRNVKCVTLKDNIALLDVLYSND
jgi:hypothetical protein